MLECKVVGELRGALNAYARGVLLYEEYGRLVRVAVDVGVNQQVVSDVTNGHVPLLAVDLVATVTLNSGGLAHGRVRTSVRLRDCICIAALALTGRDQVLFDLLLGAELHRERRLRNSVPDSAGGDVYKRQW